MSKGRIYGEDVQIRLLTNDLQPLIVDFDKVDFASLTQNKTYKAIGKRVARNHADGSGEKIVLTRVKRDNYLQSLKYYNQFCINKGIQPLLFTVEHITTHTYTVDNIDPKREFDKYMKASTQGALAGIQKAVGGIDLAKVKKIEGLISDINKIKSVVNNEAKNLGIDTAEIIQKNLLKNAQNLAVNAVGKDAESIEQIQKNIKQADHQTEEHFKNLQKVVQFGRDTQDKFNRLAKLKDILAMMLNVGVKQESFKEIYLYRNCSIGEETRSDTPHENSMESVTLFASSIECISDNNDYDDEYMPHSLEYMILHDFQRTGEYILERNKNKNPELQKEVTGGFSKLIEDYMEEIQQFNDIYL